MERKIGAGEGCIEALLGATGVCVIYPLEGTMVVVRLGDVGFNTSDELFTANNNKNQSL